MVSTDILISPSVIVGVVSVFVTLLVAYAGSSIWSSWQNSRRRDDTSLRDEVSRLVSAKVELLEGRITDLEAERDQYRRLVEATYTVVSDLKIQLHAMEHARIIEETTNDASDG